MKGSNFIRLTMLYVLLAGSHAFGETRKLRLPQAPAAVRNTINEVLKGAKLKELIRRTEDDETTYEASMTRGPVTREFVVAPDGELLSIEIGLDETPPAARATMQRVVGRGKIERIDKTLEDGEPSFEVSMERDGKTRDFTVSAEGVMTRYEMEYMELPALIRRTVQTNIATNQIERVDRMFERGELSYDVQFASNNETRVLTIETNGVLSRIEVGLNETPPAVRKAIQGQLRGGKLGDIDKVFDESEVTYDVSVKNGRAARDFTIRADGKLLSETIALADVPEVARKTIQNKIGAGKLTRIDRNYDDDGKISFDIESKTGGKAFDFSVAADGTYLGEN